MESQHPGRLLLGGILSLLLVIWLSIVPGALPGIIASPGHPPNPWLILASASLAVGAAIPLVTVLVRGSLGLRLLSLLLLIPPGFSLPWILVGGFAH